MFTCILDTAIQEAQLFLRKTRVKIMRAKAFA